VTPVLSVRDGFVHATDCWGCKQPLPQPPSAFAYTVDCPCGFSSPVRPPPPGSSFFSYLSFSVLLCPSALSFLLPSYQPQRSTPLDLVLSSLPCFASLRFPLNSPRKKVDLLSLWSMPLVQLKLPHRHLPKMQAGVSNSGSGNSVPRVSRALKSEGGCGLHAM
jgi:hypothetical protein